MFPQLQCFGKPLKLKKIHKLFFFALDNAAAAAGEFALYLAVCELL